MTGWSRIGRLLGIGGGGPRSADNSSSTDSSDPNSDWVGRLAGRGGLDRESAVPLGIPLVGGG